MFALRPEAAVAVTSGLSAANDPKRAFSFATDDDQNSRREFVALKPVNGAMLTHYCFSAAVPQATRSSNGTWRRYISWICTALLDYPVCADTRSLELEKVFSWCSIIAAFAVVGAVGYEWLDNRPVPRRVLPKPTYVTTFLNLKIGASKSDVLFARGDPDAKFIGQLKPNELWVYAGRGDQTYSFEFRSDILVSISAENPCNAPPESCDTSGTNGGTGLPDYECFKRERAYFQEHREKSVALNGISLCIGLSSLVDHLGEPDSIVDIDGGLRRRYEYWSAYNTSYTLEQRKVISLTAGAQ